MSRTPVHEAIIRLQEDGLVRVLAKRGVLICPLAPEDIGDYVSGLVIGSEFRQARAAGWLKPGEAIGIARLLARPTATVCVDIKGQDERAEGAGLPARGADVRRARGAVERAGVPARRAEAQALAPAEGSTNAIAPTPIAVTRTRRMVASSTNTIAIVSSAARVGLQQRVAPGQQESEEGEGDYWADEKSKQAHLTEEGHEHAEQGGLDGFGGRPLGHRLLVPANRHGRQEQLIVNPAAVVADPAEQHEAQRVVAVGQLLAQVVHFRERVASMASISFVMADMGRAPGVKG